MIFNGYFLTKIWLKKQQFLQIILWFFIIAYAEDAVLLRRK